MLHLPCVHFALAEPHLDPKVVPVQHPGKVRLQSGGANNPGDPWKPARKGSVLATMVAETHRHHGSAAPALPAALPASVRDPKNWPASGS